MGGEIPPYFTIMSIIGSAISAGATIFGGLLAQKNTRETNQANRELLEYQNNYNSPSQQVARLQQAGLNPLMASNLGGGQSANAIPMQTPDTSFLSEAGQSAVNTYMAQQQLNAQIQKTKAEKDNIEQSTKLLNQQTQQNTTFNGFYSQLLNGTIKMQEIDIALKDSQENVNKELARKYFNECNQINSTISKINQEVQESVERVQQLRLQNQYLPKVYKSNISEVLSRIGLNHAQSNKTAQEILNLVESNQTTVLKNKLLNLEFDFRQRTWGYDINLKKELYFNSLNGNDLLRIQSRGAALQNIKTISETELNDLQQILQPINTSTNAVRFLQPSPSRNIKNINHSNTYNYYE